VVLNGTADLPNRCPHIREALGHFLVLASNLALFWNGFDRNAARLY
jgi:hypothetical protein